MTITALPTPAPSRTQTQAAFDAAYAAHIAALPTFVTEVNADVALLNAGSGMGAIAIPYLIDTTTTTDADPGNGDIKFNNATQNAATVLYLDLLGTDNVTYTGTIDTFDDSTNTIKGYIRLVKTNDTTKWLTFSVTGLTTATGYRKITVTNIGSSAASPFANADAVTLYFTRAGDISAAPINFARVTVASAATTADIWTPAGNQIDWTGTVTCTGFPAAPQAGVERSLICAGAAPFTAGANMLIDGVASGATVTCAANDIMIVRAVTTTQFRLSRVRYDGAAQNGYVLLSTVTAAAAATVSLETGFGADYDDYIIVATGVYPSTNGATINCLLKVGGAYQTGGYYYHTNKSDSSAATYAGANGASVAAIILTGATHSGGNATVALVMDVADINNTARMKGISWKGRGSDGTVYSEASGNGLYTAGSGALTGVRFQASAGNITGVFKLYGRSK